jgi:hypothetical protein
MAMVLSKGARRSESGQLKSSHTQWRQPQLSGLPHIMEGAYDAAYDFYGTAKGGVYRSFQAGVKVRGIGEIIRFPGEPQSNFRLAARRRLRQSHVKMYLPAGRDFNGLLYDHRELPKVNYRRNCGF